MIFVDLKRCYQCLHNFVSHSFFCVIGFAAIFLLYTEAVPVQFESIYRDVFGAMFDEKLSGGSSGYPSVDTPVKYCSRKLVTGKKWIDADTYNIKINPTNMDVTNIDCFEALVPELIDLRSKMVAKLSQKGKLNARNIRCIEEEFKKEKFIGRIMVLPVLKEVTLTHAQKTVERTHFVDNLMNIIDTIEECT